MTGPNSKPLSASLAEALASKSSDVTLLSRPEPARPSPPSSSPSRISVYRDAPPKQLHALPPPEGPDRSLVATEDDAGERRRRTRKHATAAQRAEAVRRVLADGETATAVAADMGFSGSAVTLWAREARLLASKETAKKFEANDIQKVSAELAEALNLQRAATERVKVLKAKLRELLGDE